MHVHTHLKINAEYLHSLYYIPEHCSKVQISEGGWSLLQTVFTSTEFAYGAHCVEGGLTSQQNTCKFQILFV